MRYYSSPMDGVYCWSKRGAQKLFLLYSSRSYKVEYSPSFMLLKYKCCVLIGSQLINLLTRDLPVTFTEIQIENGINTYHFNPRLEHSACANLHWTSVTFVFSFSQHLCKCDSLIMSKLISWLSIHKNNYLETQAVIRGCLIYQCSWCMFIL
jgi:hypothetical protein